MRLNPVLLLAWNLCVRMSCNSSGLMWWCFWFVIGMYWSSGIVGSWNSFLLYSVHFARLISGSVCTFLQCICHNSLGCFSEVWGAWIGVLFDNFYRICKTFLLDVNASALLFPCGHRICWHTSFACLHSLLYHGARCFSQPFGFLFSCIYDLLITPALTTSYSNQKLSP